MPPRKKKTVKTPQKFKSSSPSSSAATIDPTPTPPKPLPATDSAPSNVPSTENDHQPKPKVETELKAKPEIETELKAKPEIETELKAKPSPELETNTVALEASEPTSEEAQAPEAAEAHEVNPSEISSAEPTEKPATKTVLRVRKVVKKKIVKKLVPKGSLAAKNLSSVPQQDAVMSLPESSEKNLNPKGSLAAKNLSSVPQQDAVISLPESSEKNLNPKGSLAGKKVSAMPQQDAVMSLPESSEKNLNPKGSLAGKKVFAMPQQDAVMSLQESSEKDLNPNSILDSIVQHNATEEALNPNAFQQPEPVSTVLEAESSVGIKEECPQMDAKDGILKTRKVVRKKIVKKLVPKGSLAAKKVDAVPLQDGIASLAAKKIDAVPLQDGIVSLGENTEKVFNPKPSLDSTFQQDAPEKTFNHDTNQQPEVKMEEDKKLESGKSEDNVEIKEECVEMEAKGDNLESGKEGDGFEAAEGKEHEAMGLSERMKRRKAEIFIGGLDRDAKEEDIRSVFGKVGEILELRMMMDGQTGKNKGYAFLRYLEPSQAKRAVTEFAKVEIRGKTCGAAAVQGNDTIFLGNIDKQWKKEDVLKLLKENGIENIDTITVVMDPNNADSNRGFAFVELETNKDAQRAYKKLQKKDVFGKGRNIKVAWADSFNIPDEEDMLKVKSVYAEGVPNSWDEDKLKETFEKFGEIDRIVLGRNIKSAKRRDIAFINYKTREAALSCIESFSSDELTDNGSKVNLKVALAKRVQKANQNKGQKSTVNNPFKETFKPAQGLPSQDYSPAIVGTKRTFSALGDGGMYSDLRGYPRTRLDSSFGIAGSSYSMIPHGGVGSSLHYQHQSVPSGYSTVAFSGSGNNTDAYQFRQGVPPYSSNLYHRYQK